MLRALIFAMALTTFLWPSMTLAEETPAYLIHESFFLALDGTDVMTRKPLDPERRYRVRLISQGKYGGNLAPLEFERFAPKGDGWGLATNPRDPQVQLWSGLVLDNKLARTRTHYTAQYADTRHVNALEFDLQGTGRALVMRTIRDYTGLIPARVEVIRLEPDPPPPAPAPTSTGEKWEPPEAFLWLVTAAMVGIPLMLWALARYIFEKYQDARRRAARRAREQEERERLEKLAREQDEAAQREQERKAAEEAAFRKIEAECEQRLYETALRLDLFEHYADPAFLQKAAATYQKSLIDRRDEILRGHAAFHEDRNFITYLQEHRPDLYERAIWQVKALALAEHLAAAPPAPPPRPKPTVGQVRAMILGRMDTIGHDHIAKTLKKLRLREQFLDELAHYDLEEDERAQLLREFEETLETPEEDTGNGFKKL